MKLLKKPSKKEGNNADLNFIDTSLIDDMSRLFEKSDFNGDISKWSVSSVKDMRWMFQDADSFNQPLDNWDVSKVEDMSCMFSGAKKFNRLLNKWDVSNVRDMRYMFNYTKLEKMKNFPDWY